MAHSNLHTGVPSFAVGKGANVYFAVTGSVVQQFKILTNGCQFLIEPETSRLLGGFHDGMLRGVIHKLSEWLFNHEVELPRSTNLTRTQRLQSQSKAKLIDGTGVLHLCGHGYWTKIQLLLGPKFLVLKICI